MTPPVIIEKDMAMVERDFFRLIGRFLQGKPHSMREDGFVIDDRGRTLTGTISPLPDRQITANMIIKRIMVTLVFSGYDAAEIKSLINNFDQRFQRGGG